MPTLRDQQHGSDQNRHTDPVVEAYMRDIDRTLLRQNLRLTVEERLENLLRLQRFAAGIRGAARRGPDDGA